MLRLGCLVLVFSSGLRMEALVHPAPGLNRPGSSADVQEHIADSGSALLGPAAARTLTACGAELYACGQSTLDDKWYAWLDIAQERVCLPAPVSRGYTLAEDQDGDPALQDGDHESVELAPMFTRQLYIDEGGSFWLAQVGADDELGRPLPLAEVVHEQQPHLITVLLEGRADDEIKVNIYDIPKAGARVFWDIHSAISALKLTVVSPDKPHRWLWHQFKSWQTFAMSLHRPQDVRQGMQTNSQVTCQGEDVARDLSKPSLGTPTFVALLARMAGNKAQGGMEKDIDKSLCRAMLAHLLQELAADDFDLGICIDPGLVLTWPAPLLGHTVIKLRVHEGRVDLLPLQRYVHPAAGRLHPLLRSLKLEAGLTAEPLLDFVLRCVHHRGQHSHILPQVAWAVGLRLDQLITGLGPSGLAFLGVRNTTLEVYTGNHPKDVDEALVQYWTAGLRLTKGAKDISIATDKTRGNNRGLCNAALVMPSNEAIWLTTQAWLGNN